MKGIDGNQFNKHISLGIFDWKKDKKFFARFEDPVSPEKESHSEEGT